MKITRVLPAALALVAITAGAALAVQNISTTHMGIKSCSGYGTMQSRHANMAATMGQMLQNGRHMMGNGQHMMYGSVSAPATSQSRMPGLTSDALPGMGAGR